MRICMISTFYPPYNFGGDGRSTQRLANALAERGHQVEVIYLPGVYRMLAGAEPQQPFYEHKNVILHAVEAGFETASLVLSQQLGWPVAKSNRIQSILARGFDVIHYHNISLFGPNVLTYGQAPVKLYTFHEYWLICPTHMLYRYNNVACEKPRFCSLCTLAQKRPPQLWRYTRKLKKALQHVDAFITPSDFTRHKHLQAGLDRPIEKIANFINAFVPDMTVPEQAQGEPYFLYVGNLNPVKGLQNLIPVFEHFTRAKLIIAVEGSPRADLVKEVAQSDHIVMLHDYSEQLLNRLYQHATALLVPSMAFEISSQVVMEAAARRTPVIAKNIGSVAEFARDSGAGLTYEHEQQLPAIMDRMLDHASYREGFAEPGFQTYQQQWTAEAYLQRYFALIETIKDKQSANG